ncbi:MAG: hypothetical protein M3545_05375 [Acidobacteriota bacterium]|nr:hypothetical protein [Acidobacteriota bacterium]
MRYLTRDDPAQYAKAAGFIEAATARGEQFVVNTAVLCELVWVLRTVYSYAREEIAAALEQIFATTQFEVERLDEARQALRDFRSTKARTRRRRSGDARAASAGAIGGRACPGHEKEQQHGAVRAEQDWPPSGIVCRPAPVGPCGATRGAPQCAGHFFAHDCRLALHRGAGARGTSEGFPPFTPGLGRAFHDVL